MTSLIQLEALAIVSATAPEIEAHREAILSGMAGSIALQPDVLVALAP